MKSRQITRVGLAAALAIVFLQFARMGTLSLLFLSLASLPIAFLHLMDSWKNAFFAYIVSSTLAFITLPLLQSIAFFSFFGLYPMIKIALDRKLYLFYAIAPSTHKLIKFFLFLFYAFLAVIIGQRLFSFHFERLYIVFLILFLYVYDWSLQSILAKVRFFRFLSRNK